MRLSSFVSLAAILAAAGTGTLPAAAQVLPLEMIEPSTTPVPPATIASAAEGFTLTAAPPAASGFALPYTPPAPAPVEAVAAEPETPAREASTVPQVAPLPPRPERPAVLAAAAAEPVDIAPQPLATASAGAAVSAKEAAAAGEATVARVEQLSDQDILERANAYFTGLGTLVADFTQVGGDGRRLGGTLYLQRPGKLRFEYDPPATLEVIADGTSVAVRDKKLNTQDLYFIQQTPLKFLLREHVNLGRDIAVTGISTEPNSVRINLQDSSTLGGTSRISLYFDPKVERLTQWRIVDPQGFQTVVTLNKVQRGRTLDQNLFRIPNAPIIGNSR